MSKKRILIVIIPLLIILVSLGIYFLLRSSVEEKPPLKELPKTESPAEQAISNREPLPPNKEEIKQLLLQPLKGGAGTISEGAQFKVDYLLAFDVFEVGIKTTNIFQAKEGAITWFKEKGFNEKDICNLPVTFYLVSGVAQEYRGSGLIFNPLPDFCEEKGSFMF